MDITVIKSGVHKHQVKHEEGKIAILHAGDSKWTWEPCRKAQWKFS